MKPWPPISSRPRGVALLLVLWAIGVICLALVGLTAMTQAGLQVETDLRHAATARRLAESGFSLLACPVTENDDPVLARAAAGGARAAASVEGEGGRLQINAALRRQDRVVLQRLFAGWGLSPAESDTVIDCLMDWVDPLPGRRANGAARGDYRADGRPYGPTGQEFVSLDQMEQVLHFDLLSRRQPKWRDFFTVWTDGALDVNAASADVLAAVTGAPRSKAAELVAYRNGPDRAAGTSDDARFDSLEAARAFLGMTAEAWAAVRTPLSLDSPVRRMLSMGESGPIRVTLSMVVNLAESPPAVLEWKEQ